MKKAILRSWLFAGMVITMIATSFDASAQSGTPKTYPDGTKHYPDGSVVWPNGRVRYPDGTVRQPDGSIYNPNTKKTTPPGYPVPDQTRTAKRYPNDRVIYRDRNYKHLPPGQAKKIYGSKSAKDYTPGHNKGKYGKAKKYDDDDKYEKEREKYLKERNKLDEKWEKKQEKNYSKE